VRKLRIGYQPLSSDFSQPGDRRRVVFWANHRGHEIVTDLSKATDVILLSEKADLSAFSKKAARAPIVFDLVDAYLAPEKRTKDWLRGASKVMTGQLSGNPKRFTKFVEELCTQSAAVICSSPEQQVTIRKFSSNVHVILDSHDELPMVPFSKYNHMTSQRILWEGMPATIKGLAQISEALSSIGERKRIELGLVTDESYFLFLNKYIQRNTTSLLTSILKSANSSSTVIPWSIRNLTEQASVSDVAVIPIDLSKPIQYLKPENRLLIMWRLGLPCLTSPTPAYMRVAKKAKVDSICNSPIEWLSKISEVIENRDFAEENATLGQAYIKEFHNTDRLLERWDQAFESVL
jgi:hypothetical protein